MARFLSNSTTGILGLGNSCSEELVHSLRSSTAPASTYDTSKATPPSQPPRLFVQHKKQCQMFPGRTKLLRTVGGSYYGHFS